MVTWFLPELIIDYVFLALATHWSVMSFSILKKYLKFKEKIPWFFIMLAILAITVSQYVYVYTYTFVGPVGVIPGTPFTDALWLLSFIFFSAGTLSYYVIIQRLIGKGVPVKEISLILISSLLVFQISYFGFSGEENSFLYSLHLAFSMLCILSCIPVLLMFRGGFLAKPWLYFCASLIIFIIAVISYIFESVWELGFSLSEYIWLVSGVLITLAFYKMMTGKDVKLKI